MHALIKFLFKERKDKNPINQNLLLKSIAFFSGFVCVNGSTKGNNKTTLVGNCGSEW